ncbi:MAG: DMT family transporter [Verrucomicrobiales bacterium]|nr:DMT family transporter [Verrucomicrobiales bacterium]
MKSAHLVLLLLLNAGWACMPTIATQLSDQVGARQFVFLRYGLAFVGLVVLWPWLPGSAPRGRDFWRAVVMGITVFNVGHILQVAGIQSSYASDASLLIALDPLVSSLGAALFLHEAIPGRRWVGFALAIAGVGLMSLWHPEAPLPGLVANLLIVLSFVSEAVWSVMGKPLIERCGVYKMTVVGLGAGTVANLLVLAADGPAQHVAAIARMSGHAWLLLGFLGIVLTAFGYSVWLIVIREVPVSVAAMTIYLQPIFGTLVAIWATQERLHFGHLLGCLAIVAGVVVGASSRSKNKSRAVQADPSSGDVPK